MSATRAGRWMAIVAWGLAVGLGACRTGDSTATPEGAVRQFVRAARQGDGAAAFRLLGPRTRERLEGQARQGAEQLGTRGLTAQNLVAVGWVPPSWEAASVRVARRENDRAEVEVTSRAGDRQLVDMVLEAGGWRLELPLR